MLQEQHWATWKHFVGSARCLPHFPSSSQRGLPIPPWREPQSRPSPRLDRNVRIHSGQLAKKQQRHNDFLFSPLYKSDQAANCTPPTDSSYGGGSEPQEPFSFPAGALGCLVYPLDIFHRQTSEDLSSCLPRTELYTSLPFRAWKVFINRDGH